MNMRMKLPRVKLLIMLLIALGFGNTPYTLAANTQVLVSQVQVRKSSAIDRLSHLHEAIIIKNDSEDDVDITNWCVYYASVSADFSDGSKRKIGCLTPKVSSNKVFIKAGGLVRFGSFDPDFFNPAIFYAPSFSQGLGNEKGKLLLLDGSQERDRVEWGSHPGALNLSVHAAFARKQNELGVLQYSGSSKDDFEVIEQVDVDTEVGVYSKDDACPADEGFQHSSEQCEPEGVVTEETLVSQAPGHTLQIVEFFPNPAGTDTGKEFIELHNFGDRSLRLQDYSVTIEGSSQASKKIYSLPDLAIVPGEYVAIYNTGQQGFSLNNTSGKITLLSKDVQVDVASYSSTKEGYSWSLIGNDFMLSLPSPDSENIPEDLVLIDKAGRVVEVKPCDVGQERNPATGRCRKIPVVSAVVPCKVGQERNPETGRCRNIAKKAVPAPCKAGQERNPTTGRCRNIKRVVPQKVADGVEAVKVDDSSSVWLWITAGAVLLGALVYMVWEWRLELKQLLSKIANRNKKPKDDL